jgi:hypothetical protein
MRFILQIFQYLDCIMSDYCIGKHLKGSVCGLTEVNPNIFLKGLRKTSKNFSYDSRYRRYTNLLVKRTKYLKLGTSGVSVRQPH